MLISDLARNPIVVQLPPSPHTADELELAAKIAADEPGCDMVVDCSKLSLVSCTALCGSMKLRKVLKDNGRRLLFANVGVVLRGVFSIYGFDQVFDVVDDKAQAESSSEVSADDGQPVLAGTEDIKRAQRRNYRRLEVCEVCTLEVLLWRKAGPSDNQSVLTEQCLSGRLLDISSGGAEIGLNTIEKAHFEKDQIIGLSFRPYGLSIELDALVKQVLPTADAQGICLGLQFIGLEANRQARQHLEQFCQSLERYEVQELAPI